MIFTMEQLLNVKIKVFIKQVNLNLYIKIINFLIITPIFNKVYFNYNCFKNIIIISHFFLKYHYNNLINNHDIFINIKMVVKLNIFIKKSLLNFIIIIKIPTIYYQIHNQYYFII